MDYISAGIIAVVEGITEYLPVSSTAHILLTEKALGISSAFALTFAIFIQGASILAIIALYFKKVIKNISLVPKIVLAFLPTMLVGFFLYDIIKNIFLESLPLVTSALFVGGILILMVDRKNQAEEKDVQNITYKESFILGLSQLLAFVPGMSRSGSTIIGGRLARIPRKMIVEFSFLLAIPTILGATVLDLVKTDYSFSSHEINMLVFGGAVSFITSLFVARWLLKYLSNHSFKIFGWYRIVLAIFIFLFFII